MSDTKHGWVTPRADGARARCGGPDVCGTCQTEQMHETMLKGLFGAEATPLPSQPSEEAHRVALGIARAALVEIGNLADVDADDRSTIVRIALGNIDSFLAAHASNQSTLAQAAVDLTVYGMSVVRIAPVDTAAVASTLDSGNAPRPSWLDGGADAAAMAREDGLLPAASAAGDALDAARWRSFRSAITRQDLDWLERMDTALLDMGCDVDSENPPSDDQVDAAADAAIAQQKGKV